MGESSKESLQEQVDERESTIQKNTVRLPGYLCQHCSLFSVLSCSFVMAG